MPRSGISGPYVNPVFLRNLHTAFHSGCIDSHSQKPVCEDSFFPALFPTFFVGYVLTDSHSEWSEVKP
jgi:hypothetical protein